MNEDGEILQTLSDPDAKQNQNFDSSIYSERRSLCSWKMSFRFLSISVNSIKALGIKQTLLKT